MRVKSITQEEEEFDAIIGTYINYLFEVDIFSRGFKIELYKGYINDFSSPISVEYMRVLLGYVLGIHIGLKKPLHYDFYKECVEYNSLYLSLANEALSTITLLSEVRENKLFLKPITI
jgi:hypothetical protein